MWESLYNLAEVTNTLWIVGGDFNVICKEEEKLGEDQLQIQKLNILIIVERYVI